MKKISEWLNELPEPYRTQAIANQEWQDYEVNRLSGAIANAFSWHDSPQGHEYWHELYDSKLRDEIDDGKKI
jgi:hypothetical protein